MNNETIPDNKAVLRRIKTARTKIAANRDKKAELEGRRKAALEQLSSSFGLTSVEEAQVRVDELEAELKDKRGQLTDLLEELDGIMGDVSS